MTITKCQAKNPAACPYHGLEIRYNNALKTYTTNPTLQNSETLFTTLGHWREAQTDKELQKALLQEEEQNPTNTQDPVQSIKPYNHLLSTYEWRHPITNKLHREDGPAIEYPNGDRKWYQNGVLHREDGPAITGKGYEKWYQKGALHREDGPAVTVRGEDPTYWIHGKEYRVRWVWESELKKLKN